MGACLPGRLNPSYKHGHALKGAHSKMYQCWENMIKRCYTPTNNRYYRYGARGIKVCARWRHSFINFLADMGICPVGKSLDRINSDGNYKPSNCRWADRIQQALTRKGTLNYGGKSLRQRCLGLGISYKAAHWRLRHGKNPFILERKPHGC
jgi:hypothetical protein